MAFQNNNSPRKPNRNRVNSPTAWIMGGAILVVLLGGLFFYDGRDATPKSGDNPVNVITGKPNK
jgi:hypothetical protein